jgi:hypothetical protein
MATEIFAILAASGLAMASAPAAQNTRSSSAMPVASAQLVSASAIKPVGSSCFAAQVAGRAAKKACSAALVPVKATDTGVTASVVTKSDLLPVVLITTATSVGITQAINGSNSRD